MDSGCLVPVDKTTGVFPPAYGVSSYPSGGWTSHFESLGFPAPHGGTCDAQVIRRETVLADELTKWNVHTRQVAGWSMSSFTMNVTVCDVNPFLNCMGRADHYNYDCFVQGQYAIDMEFKKDGYSLAGKLTMSANVWTDTDTALPMMHVALMSPKGTRIINLSSLLQCASVDPARYQLFEAECQDNLCDVYLKGGVKVPQGVVLTGWTKIGFDIKNMTSGHVLTGYQGPSLGYTLSGYHQSTRIIEDVEIYQGNHLTTIVADTPECIYTPGTSVWVIQYYPRATRASFKMVDKGHWGVVGIKENTPWTPVSEGVHITDYSSRHMSLVTDPKIDCTKNLCQIWLVQFDSQKFRIGDYPGYAFRVEGTIVAPSARRSLASSEYEKDRKILSRVEGTPANSLVGSIQVSNLPHDPLSTSTEYIVSAVTPIHGTEEKSVSTAWIAPVIVAAVLILALVVTVAIVLVCVVRHCGKKGKASYSPLRRAATI